MRDAVADTCVSCCRVVGQRVTLARSIAGARDEAVTLRRTLGGTCVRAFVAAAQVPRQ